MKKMIGKPDCYGGMLKGNIYAERDCDTCPVVEACDLKTAGCRMKKKDLDPKWVQELMSQIIGPQITIMMMRTPKSAENLTEIIQAAVTELYKNNDYDDTNAWVVAASDRVIHLYNTFMTAKLIDLFDKGIPDAPRIIARGDNIKH